MTFLRSWSISCEVSVSIPKYRTSGGGTPPASSTTSPMMSTWKRAERLLRYFNLRLQDPHSTHSQQLHTHYTDSAATSNCTRQKHKTAHYSNSISRIHRISIHQHLLQQQTSTTQAASASTGVNVI